MSELKYTLDIKPTRHGTRTETNYVRNIPCPRCNAQGGFLDKTVATNMPSPPVISATVQEK